MPSNCVGPGSHGGKAKSLARARKAVAKDARLRARGAGRGFFDFSNVAGAAPVLSKDALEGKGWFDFLDPNKNGVGDAFNKVKHEFVDSDSNLHRGVADAAAKVGNEFTNPDSVLRGQVVPIAGKVGDVLNKIPGVDFVPGLGELAMGASALSKVNNAAKAAGFGKPHAGPVGAALRREAVAKVMKEKKLSLPAASAYVKAHGLWKK